MLETIIGLILSGIAIGISIVSLYFTWRKWKREKPIISHEVFKCLHKVAKNYESNQTYMEIEFRLHNRGDRGTRLTKIEAVATDAADKQHSSSQELSDQLNACDSTKKITCLFSFSPRFSYKIKMLCRFNIIHTHGQYPFTHESQESERYLEQIDVSSAYVPK